MIISAETDHRAWDVYHAQERRRVLNVTWVDTERAEWRQYVGVSIWGVLSTELHKAERIEVDVENLRITINPGPWPEVPVEVWNPIPVDADRAIAAVRAMCG